MLSSASWFFLLFTFFFFMCVLLLLTLFKYPHRFVPKAIHQRLEQDAINLVRSLVSLADIRPLTVMFIQIHGLDVVASPNVAQMLMLQIQRSVYHWHGSINKLLMDDKGLLVLCAWGLPPVVVLDAPVMALGAGLDLLAAAPVVSPAISLSIGVATGRTYCGIVGSDSRCEFTMIGRVVNTAARLMSAAGPGELFSDQNTIQASLQKFYVEPRELKLKGYRTLTTNYKIGGWIGDQRTSSESTAFKKQEEDIIGRELELKALMSICHRLIRYRGGTLVITGDHGSGKGALLLLMTKNLESEGNSVFTVQADSKASVNVEKSFARAVEGKSGTGSMAQKYFGVWHNFLEILIHKGALSANKRSGEWIHDALAAAREEAEAQAARKEVEHVENLENDLWMLYVAIPAVAYRVGETVPDDEEHGLVGTFHFFFHFFPFFLNFWFGCGLWC